MCHPGLVRGENDNDYSRQLQQYGLEAQQHGEYGKALFYYERAAGFRPNDPSLHNDIGLMCEQLGKLDEAEASYRTAIENDTRYLPAYSNLGILLKKRGRYELAAMYLQHRIELGRGSDPWMLKAQEELEDLYLKAPYLKNQRTLESSAELEQQIARDRSMARHVKARAAKINYELYMKRGLEAFSAGDYAGAVGAFEEALAVEPGSSDASHALKRAEAQVRQTQVADELQVSVTQNHDWLLDRAMDRTEGVPERDATEDIDE
ncbi:MAG: tetratricopeptide repeat protein [Candidatus Omnitrophica bacterium]|nr:tetratricopeptide repeat protein [Candidatus Omnitrophota bacterium]